jgi:hypothetical protein
MNKARIYSIALVSVNDSLAESKYRLLKCVFGTWAASGGAAAELLQPWQNARFMGHPDSPLPWGRHSQRPNALPQRIRYELPLPICKGELSCPVFPA